MPHVASDLKSQMLARSLPQAGKQTYASASPAATPFDSILDETSRPDPAPRAQRASDDNSPRATRADRPKPVDRPDRAAKSDDSKPADSKADATDGSKVDTTDAGSAAVSTKTADTGNTDTQSADPAAKSDDLKAAADAAALIGAAQPADTTAVAAVAVVIDPALALAAVPSDAKDAATTETKAGTTAITAAATATVAQPDAKAAEATTDAALAATTPDALAALAAKADKTVKTDKAEVKTDKKAATDKPAVAAKATGNVPAPQQLAATAQATGDEPHKDTGGHVRAEETANVHRGTTPDAAAATVADNSASPAPQTANLTPPPVATVQSATPALQATAVSAPTAAAQPSAVDRAIPISGVAFEITNKALAGKGQFDIRLDPPDLGRIHVRLDVDRDGNVITHMVADRTDTLDMLRKDTAGLERARAMVESW